MNPAHLLRYVIQETLLHLSAYEPRMDGPVPRALLLGTAMVESNLTELQQRDGGPAMGLWQCEPATHDDCWLNFLSYRPHMHAAFRELAVFDPTPEQMRWNLVYGCAMARLVYWRAREALPDGLKPYELAGYWKRHFNTEAGAGDQDKAVPAFAKAIRYVQ